MQPPSNTLRGVQTDDSGKSLGNSQGSKRYYLLAAQRVGNFSCATPTMGSISFHQLPNEHLCGRIRQRGSCIGSLALEMARPVLINLSKYILISAKSVEKNLFRDLLIMDAESLKLQKASSTWQVKHKKTSRQRRWFKKPRKKRLSAQKVRRIKN